MRGSQITQNKKKRQKKKKDNKKIEIKYVYANIC